MLISHEVPINLLEKSKKFNDYDYCLLHLTYKYPEYRKFYRNSDRRVLLDNSLFELGDSLSNEELAKGVLDINPTWYVIPDCLNNTFRTIERFKSFIKDYSYLPGLKIGVVQGKTLKSLVRCYKYMSKYADKIAIPFDCKGFSYFFNTGNKLHDWMIGRRWFIDYLVNKGIWNFKKPHHLLGCSLADEFSYYDWDYLNIESLDTSNPVVAGLKGLRYDKYGLDIKPSVKLCELINVDINNKEE